MEEIVDTNDRILYLINEVENDSAKEIIKSILRWDREDEEDEQTIKGFEREPITLYINSPGGYVREGRAILSAICCVKTPIHTVCIGDAASMAFHIFIAGDKRTASPFSRFMYHAMGGAVSGQEADLEDCIREVKEISNFLDQFLCERTNLTMEMLKKYRNSSKDWWMGVEKAKKLGIVQEILPYKKVDTKLT